MGFSMIFHLYDRFTSPINMRAAGCVQVIQVAVMQQQAMTAKNSAASISDNGVAYFASPSHRECLGNLEI